MKSKEWIKKNSLTAFFAGTFLLSIPVYAIIYIGKFNNTHVESRLSLIAAYSAVLSAVIVSSVKRPVPQKHAVQKQYILFIIAFFIFGLIESIDHILWNHKISTLLIYTDIIMVSIAAYIISAIFSGNQPVRHLLRKMINIHFSTRILVFSLVFWPLLVLISNMFAKVAGQTVPEPATFPAVKFIILIIESFFWYLIFGGSLNEEAGWRGFALPLLQKKYSPLLASVIIGFFWGLWHVPIHLLGFYPYGAAGAVIRIFSIPLAVIFTWVYNQSNNSLIPVLILHAAVNTTSLFMPRHFIISSLVMTLFATGIAIYGKMWKKNYAIYIKSTSEPLVSAPSSA